MEYYFEMRNMRKIKCEMLNVTQNETLVHIDGGD